MLFLIVFFSFFNFYSLELYSKEQTLDNCDTLDSAFIIGDYTLCENTKLIDTSSLRCRYLASLCMIANKSYDKARYELSLISAQIPKTANAPGEYNALALTSLVELAFLQGDFSKARSLSSTVNTLLSQKLADSYPYSVNELLVLKSYLDLRALNNAKERIKIIKSKNKDQLLYSALDPWN